MDVITQKLFLYIIIVFSSILHEFSHALSAYYLGDPTAKNEGRLTLNPIPHLDLWGTVIIPLFLLFFVGGFIGWAKPVPFNPYNLKNQKWGQTIVAFSGPIANFVLAVIFGLLIRFTVFPSLLLPFAYIVYINIFLGLFNLIPVPPLDGSKLIFDLFPKYREVLQGSFLGIFIALFIGITFLPYLANMIFTLITGKLF